MPTKGSDECHQAVFKDLASTQLLEKCLEGYTPNANECLNGLIWKYCPKVGNHGLRTVNNSAALAISTFSGGAAALGRVLEEMGLHVGIFSSNFFAAKNSACIKNGQRQASQVTTRQEGPRGGRDCLDEQQDEAEGFPYMAGGH